MIKCQFYHTKNKQKNNDWWVEKYTVKIIIHELLINVFIDQRLLVSNKNKSVFIITVANLNPYVNKFHIFVYAIHE